MSGKVILSISILTSGEKAELEKCLQSIQRLRDKIPSELIVVDTGCDEKSKTIIEKYATKVVKFEWCNDFSKARNAGLRECSGTWFLYLDDDEWFEDPKEIIDFFQTGEYRHYQYAMYKQRNYEDREGIKYSEEMVGRMIRLTQNTCFKYRIHECFNDVGNPVKYFNTFVHHYGYVYENEEQRLAHAKRNIAPLLEECKEEPGNLRHKLQLMQEYHALGMMDEVIRIGKNVITSYDSDENEQIFYFNSLILLTLDDMRLKKETAEMIALGEKLRKHPYIGKLAEAYVCALLSYGYLLQNDYFACARCIDDYVRFWKDYQTNPSFYTPFETGILSLCFSENVFCVTMLNGINKAIEQNDLKHASAWIETYTRDAHFIITEKDLIEKVIETLLCKDENIPYAVRMCNDIVKNNVSLEWAKVAFVNILSKLPVDDAEKLKKRYWNLERNEWCDKEYKRLCSVSDTETITTVKALLKEYWRAETEWNALFFPHDLKMDGDKNIVIQSTEAVEELLANYDLKDESQIIASLKKLLLLRPEWKNAIKICLQEEARKMQEQQELYQLRSMLKQKASVMIQNQEYDEAKTILEQLIKIFPDDDDCKKMYENIA